MRSLIAFAVAGLLTAQDAIAPSPATPINNGFAAAATLDALINEAIESDQIPGAVVAIGHKGRIVYQKAYGNRALVPRKEPMTLETIFDAASLTKVVATTSAIAKLVEDGRLRINEPVTKYLPEYQGGRSDLTVRQLLTHTSGLRPDVDLKPEWSGYDTGIKLAVSDRPTAVADTRYIYSDINFVLLGEIVHRLTGMTLPQYVKTKIFDPLGMRDTMFQPPPNLRPRIAPTEILPGTAEPLRGVVHDPTARFMGGVAGHAGLFTTAGDLAKFAEMMLGLGERNGVRVLSPLTVRMFTSPQTPSNLAAVRGLGWDINSPNSGNRGDLFPIGSYGHTGFTGTSMWIDPATESYVILMTNSVHPKVRPAITPLRGRVANVAAAGLGVDFPIAPVQSAARPLISSAPPRNGDTLSGLDVLVAEKFASLQGKKIGLITNHTGLSRDGKRNIDLMRAAGVQLVALYSPEHGISGKEDHENIGDTRDPASGVRVYSLYSGPNRRPSAEMLKGVDTLVFDIQDIGTRFYTYLCTMRNSMEEAAQRNLEFIVLDRPNPINGVAVEGPVIEPGLNSFVGCGAIPLRHGMTAGELAQMFNAEITPKARLQVIRMKNWLRTDWLDNTGLPWVNPSPNMRSLTAALLYPGIGMLEYAKNYSVGRGTDAPFEQIGADWIRGRELAAHLNGRMIPGIRVYPIVFTPTASNFANQQIEGVRFVITDRDAFPSVRFGFELAAALRTLYPGKMDFAISKKLIGSEPVVRALESGTSASAVVVGYSPELSNFQARRARYLLY